MKNIVKRYGLKAYIKNQRSSYNRGLTVNNNEQEEEISMSFHMHVIP